jgi:hypothetical protein
MDRITIPSTGFPGTNKTWRFLQACFAEPLAALAALAGDKTIISGVNVVFNGQLVTQGFISYNSELILFQQSAPGTTVKIYENTEFVNYNVDANNDQQLDSLPAYITRYATCGTGNGTVVASFPFSDLKRLKTVKELTDFALPDGIVIDSNYIPFTNELLTKLNGIQAGAQVNVKPNWLSPESATSGILNKPNAAIILKQGTIMAGDIQNGNLEFTAVFTSIGTSIYQVIPSFEATSEGVAAATATLFYAIHSKTATSFKIRLRESGSFTQSLRIRYTIIKA